MNIKTLGLLASLALLAACSSNGADTGAAAGAGGANGLGGAGMAGGPGGYGAGGAYGAGRGAPGSEEDLAQNVGDRIFFDTDQSRVSTGEQRATLDKQAAWLQQYPQVAVQIAGNCDERGTEEYNLALGQRRANSARDYLVTRGVQSARINTISFGKDRPVDPGSNPQAWAQNRNAITSVR